MDAGGQPSADGVQLPDHAACALLRTDAEGLILLVNQPFCDWVGYRKTDLIGKRKLQELFSMGGRIFHQTHWAPLLQLQGSISEVKLDVLHKSGHRIPMVLNAIQRLAEGAAVVHDVAAFVARDRDKYERELIESRKEMQTLVAEANRLRALADQMVAIVSHDLRTPLSVIKMSASLLSRSDASPRQSPAIERIARAATRAAKLTDDLLDFGQARLNNAIRVHRMPGDIHRAVAETVEELKVANPTIAIRHYAAGLGSCLFDAARMAQVVVNLVSNAVAYGKNDSVIEVKSVIDADSFSVSVHNEGTPIPQSMLLRVFEPMVRGQATPANQHGMGLGLFITMQIVKSHGGNISVESSEGLGTRFMARLPRSLPKQV